MRMRVPTLSAVLCYLLLVGTSAGLWGCGVEPAPGGSESAPPSSTKGSTEAPATPTFEEAWAASLAALEALGPTRVTIVETTEGHVTGDEIPPEQSSLGTQSKRAEQLLDVAGGRARLTVHRSDGWVETTVVNGREKTTTSGGSLTTSTAGLVSVSRYISVEPPSGLPLPLWVGNAVGPGYADLFQDEENGAGSMPTEGKVERWEDGGTRLSRDRATKGITSNLSIILNSDHLPMRIEITGEGTPEEGELQGIGIEYSMTIEYSYQPVASFSDSDFVLDVPPGAYRESVTHELSLERPWSEQVDWGQYWLGEAVGEWKLTRAEHALHEESPDLGFGAAPRDEGVYLTYERPDKTSPNESISMFVRPLRGRYFEDSRTFAEQRVASGDWVRQEMTLAGRPATIFSGALEGGADSRIDSIYVFLPDAFMNIQVWAPVDPLLVLETLSPVE